MKVVVTGSDGMLGTALCPELRLRGHDVIPTDRQPSQAKTTVLDVCRREDVIRFLELTHPQTVIHLAAETDVDRCEQEPAHAYRVNAAGTEHVVAACQHVGSRLLYISTAAVFDGKKPTPYIETDCPAPVNVYGRSKLAGEFAVQRHAAHQIIRAGWMVGGYEHDKKFVGKLLRLLEEHRDLAVVTDKRGTLTFTNDFSRGIAALLETAHTGVFHMANHGACTRFEVACKLVEYLGRADITLRPVTSDAFPLPAPRSPSEALENQRLRSLRLDAMPTWQQALQDYVQQYLKTVKSCASSS